MTTDSDGRRDPLTVGRERDYVAPKDRVSEPHREADGLARESGATPQYEGGVNVGTESTAYSPEIASKHYGTPGYDGPHLGREGRVDAPAPATREDTWGDVLEGGHAPYERSDAGSIQAAAPADVEAAAHSSANLDSDATGTDSVEAGAYD